MNSPNIEKIKPPVTPLQTSVKGKVQRTRKHEKKFYTAIITPAADEYSRPSTIEIRSDSRLGDTDEVITCDAVLSGYAGRPYKVTDKETGELRSIIPVNHVLDAIEK